MRLGFVDAAARFDPTTGHVFSTYATWWALRRAKEYVHLELAGGTHVPLHHGLTTVRTVSLATPLGPNEGAQELGDTVAARPGADPPAEFPPDFWARLGRVLDARSCRVLELYFRDGLTDSRIAERVGVTNSRVQQIRQRALAQLRARPELFAELRGAA